MISKNKNIYCQQKNQNTCLFLGWSNFWNVSKNEIQFSKWDLEKSENVYWPPTHLFLWSSKKFFLIKILNGILTIDNQWKTSRCQYIKDTLIKVKLLKGPLWPIINQNPIILIFAYQTSLLCPAIYKMPKIDYSFKVCQTTFSPARQARSCPDKKKNHPDFDRTKNRLCGRTTVCPAVIISDAC